MRQANDFFGVLRNYPAIRGSLPGLAGVVRYEDGSVPSSSQIMPIPRFTPSKVRSATPDRPWLFVSYSHKDLQEFGEHFIQALRLLLKGHPDLGYDEDRIYFDQHRLKAGEDWDDSIQAAVESAGILVLLVSTNSLSSTYCMTREVFTAVQRRIRVITVVLSQCQWARQPLPGDSRGRCLGALGAIPKDAAAQWKPVRDWDDADTAWTVVCEQLAHALRKDGPSEPVDGLAVRGGVPVLPPLLPYFCNQVPIVRRFSGALGETGESALLVLLKGTLDDSVPRFWDRLVEGDLKPFSNQRRSLPCLEQRSLHWPSAFDGTRVRGDDGIEEDVMEALSGALTGQRYAFRREGCGEQIARRLIALPEGLLPLMGSASWEAEMDAVKMRKGLLATVRALARILDACPEGTPLHRLVIALLLEDRRLGTEPPLPELLRAACREGTRGLRVVELDALLAFPKEHVVKWHRDHGVAGLGYPDVVPLLAHAFPDPLVPKIRFRSFVERLKNLPTTRP